MLARAGIPSFAAPVAITNESSGKFLRISSRLSSPPDTRCLSEPCRVHRRPRMSDGHHTFSQHMSEHHSDDDEAGAALTADFLAQLARVDVDMRAAWPRMHELVPPLETANEDGTTDIAFTI